MLRNFIFCLFFICILGQLKAQTKDSTNIFSLRDFYAQVLLYHPITKQSNLITDIAAKELLMTRGQFDPKAQVEYNTKEQGQKFYYSYWDSALKLPLWIGEIKAGYELNEGELISLENKTPARGLQYVGLTVPLGQNLLIDERRATLRQAKLLQEMAEADRVKELNKLFLNATKAYWDWYMQYNEYQYVLESFRLAEQRFTATKNFVQNGELAPLDSVEAKINYQEREVLLRQSEIGLLNARLILSNFLWRDDSLPLELPDNAIPQDFDLSSRFVEAEELERMLTFAQRNHPEIIKIGIKVQQLEVERRFQQDRLKPQINLTYNFLRQVEAAPGAPAEQINMDLLRNNYKFGIEFVMPLFLRKERGKSQQTKFKLQQTVFERSNVSREIITNINTVYNELKNLERIIVLQQDMVNNSQVLREGEYQKFINGESTVFIVNTREVKLVETQIKLVNLRAKYEKEKATLRWAAGERLWELPE